MMLVPRSIIFVLGLLFLECLAKSEQDALLKSPNLVSCDVIIAGGSTAALAAALSSASEGVATCLLEPTDWVGGQLTTSGVSAIDFAWHKVVDHKTGFVLDVGAIDRDPENQTPNFWKVLQALTTEGRCWVSIICYPPLELIPLLQQMIQELSPHLQVFYNTVVKQVTMNEDSSIESIIAVQRTPVSGVECGGYDIRTSQDIKDWYSPLDSYRYSKQILQFSSANDGTQAIFMDATEWGELLVLSGAPYLQGIDERFDGDTSGIGDTQCGQGITVDFIEIINPENTTEPPNPYHVDHPDYYSLSGFSWDQVWTYRRVFSTDWGVETNDQCLQNWDKGNDYPFATIFLNKNESLASILAGNWTGGINIETLDGAERLAYGYHYWFKKQNETLEGKLTMDKTALGTCHGLTKLPYMRESRRSIGVDNFLMKIVDISGNATQMVGNIFEDRIAIGAYDVDIHAMDNCTYPAYMYEYYPILPFYIPMRALTNKNIGNLLVAGKTIAQSFLVNAATRLHPVEWSSGTGAGVVAAFMVNNGIETTSEALKYVSQIQERVKLYTPIQWTINGTKYPPEW